MGSRFISAVAFYGPKSGPLRDLLIRVQDLIAGSVGGDFRPYSLDQVHTTLIALNGVRDPRTGAVVNEYFLSYCGATVTMDLNRVAAILARRFAAPLQVRLGGFGRDQDVPFTSRGQHLHERSFSVQDDAFVLVGWPAVSLAGAGRPVDDMRREMASAGVLHRYHAGAADVDNDLHLVVGHHGGARPGAVARAEAAVRDMLAAEPVDLAVGLAEIKVVAACSRTLAPPLYVSPIPADEAAVLALMS